MSEYVHSRTVWFRALTGQRHPCRNPKSVLTADAPLRQRITQIRVADPTHASCARHGE